jgi:hypothetical protein
VFGVEMIDATDDTKLDAWDVLEGMGTLAFKKGVIAGPLARDFSRHGPITLLAFGEIGVRGDIGASLVSPHGRVDFRRAEQRPHVFGTMSVDKIDPDESGDFDLFFDAALAPEGKPLDVTSGAEGTVVNISPAPMVIVSELGS